jgi:hypothetical protein
VLHRHGVKCLRVGRQPDRRRDAAVLRDYHAGLSLVQIAIRNEFPPGNSIIAVLHRLERDGETVHWRGTTWGRKQAR